MGVVTKSREKNESSLGQPCHSAVSSICRRALTNLLPTLIVSVCKSKWLTLHPQYRTSTSLYLTIAVSIIPLDIRARQYDFVLTEIPTPWPMLSLSRVLPLPPEP